MREDEAVHAARQAFAVEVAREKLRKRKVGWLFPVVLVPLVAGPVYCSSRNGWPFPWAMVGYTAGIFLLFVGYKLFFEVRFHRTLRDEMSRMLDRAATAADDGTPEPVAEEYARYVRGTAFHGMNGMLRKRFRLDLAP